ncbi:hypothetical protein T484DRAFT_1780775 [Baffinella frigidus]|nr:hypothetical protein T484DRAFT_1780775 [Cryptophyta sp. CCMP2293]
MAPRNAWRHGSALACVLALVALEAALVATTEEWDGGGAEEDVGACGEEYEHYWACRDEHEHLHPSDALSACAAPLSAVDACKAGPTDPHDPPPGTVDPLLSDQEERAAAGGVRMALLQPKHWEVFDLDAEVSKTGELCLS